MHSLLKAAIILLWPLIIFGCSSSSDFGTTDSGLEYKFIKHGNGKMPKDGDFLLLNIAYHDENNNKMFSSEDRGGALPMSFLDSLLSKNGSIEECFTMVGEGDSAVFQILAKNLFANSYHIALPDTVDADSKITLELGIDKVLSKAEFSEYRQTELEKARKRMEESQKLQLNADLKVIDDYLSKNNIDAESIDEGLKIVHTSNGQGDYPKPGQVVMVDYTGRFLDGEVFDTSNEQVAKENNVFSPGRRYEPYTFTLGQGSVIRGWDVGLQKIREGGEATLFVPSPLGYGVRGMGKIKPNSILKFDVKLVGIVKK